MASKLIPVKQLDDIAECPICTEVYTDPRVLPCIHTYCLKCIKGWCKDKLPGHQVACPLCRKEFTIPSDGPTGLPKNFFIDKLLMVKELTSSKSLESPCDVCSLRRDVETKSVAKSYCLDCQEKLCETCDNVHRCMKTSRSHKIVELGQELNDQALLAHPVSRCDAHEDKSIEIYCSECRVAICMMCYIERHNSHTCSSLVKVSEDFCQQINDDLVDVMGGVETCRYMLENVEKNKKSFMEQIVVTEKGIRDKAEQLKSMIEKGKQTLLDDLRKAKQTNLKDIDTLSTDLERHLMSMEGFEKYVNELLKKGTPCDIVRAGSGLHDRAQELVVFDSMKRALDDLGQINVTFTPSGFSFKDSKETIGKVVVSKRPAVAYIPSAVLSQDSSKATTKVLRVNKPEGVVVSKISGKSASGTETTQMAQSRCKPFRQPVGLMNLDGTTCYFNAVMQIIRQSPFFWELLQNRVVTTEIPAKHVYLALKILNTSLPQNIWPDLCIRIAIGGYTSEGPLGVRFEIPLSILNESKGVFALQLYRETTKELLGSALMNIQRNLLTAAELSDTPTMRDIVFQNNRSHSMRFEMSVSFSPSTVIQSLINFFNETAVLDGNGTHKPSELLNSICARSDKYGGQLQQDSHELLRRLMDAVKEEEHRFNADGKSTRSPQAENYPRESVQLTIVEQVFGGHFLTVFHCHKCQMLYHLFEPFLDISLQIVPPDTESEARSRHTQRNSGRQNDRNVGLFTASTMMEPTARSAGGRQPTEYETAIRAMKEPMAVVSIDCLQQGAAFSALTKSFSVVQSLIHYTREEQLQEHLCLNCNKNNDGTNYKLTPGTKQTIIYDPPAVLMIHIKRFMQNANGNYRKYEELVLFEETLDLAPFCSQHSKRQQRDKNIMYRLYGVIVHIGDLQSGHYTACVKMREVDDGGKAMKFLQAEFLDRQSLMDKKKFIELLGNPSKYLKDEPDPQVDSNGQWFEISDTGVDSISFDRVRRQQAYILFYERVH